MTQNELKEIVVYNPDTGIFTWRHNRGVVKAGAPIYLQKKKNSLLIKICGKKYPVQRLAWLYTYGKLPSVVSHKNGDLHDNRIDNLQDRQPEQQKKQIPPEMTAEYLRSIITYNPDTGEFFWAVDRAINVKAGSPVFQTINSNGYYQIVTSGRQYRSHRLAWLYMYGEWPNVIDHINGDRLDNRICNLRSGTSRANARNTKKHREGRLVGASYVKHIDKWVAQVVHKEVNPNRPLNLGYYATELEAHEVYMKYCIEHDLF